MSSAGRQRRQNAHQGDRGCRAAALAAGAVLRRRRCGGLGLPVRFDRHNRPAKAGGRWRLPAIASWKFIPTYLEIKEMFYECNGVVLVLSSEIREL